MQGFVWVCVCVCGAFALNFFAIESCLEKYLTLSNIHDGTSYEISRVNCRNVKNSSNIPSNIILKCWISCWMKCWMNFLGLYTSIQHRPSNIQEFFTNSIYNWKLKSKAEQSFILVVLSEWMGSDDKNVLAEKSDRG